MPVAHVWLLALLVVFFAQSATGAKKCRAVQCLTDPCRATNCNPPPDWACVVNQCGRCSAQWQHSITNLTLSQCPPSSCPAEDANQEGGVCGTDLRTYPNACTALMHGARVQYNGMCLCRKHPPMPVCATDGRYYRSSCYARRNNTWALYEGRCLLPNACSKEDTVYNPVCDYSTGLTWTNPCVAKLNGVTAYVAGPCTSGSCLPCAATEGCNAVHRCQNDTRYFCSARSCNASHVLDNGVRASYASCSPVYVHKLSLYPANSCY